MDYQTLLLDLRTHYDTLKREFNKEETSFQCLKTYRQGKLHGVFTRSYWARKDLFRLGNIVYGFVFKDYRDEVYDNERDFPFWCLMSGESFFIEHPDFYETVLANLEQFANAKAQNRKEKSLQRAFNGYLSEPHYFELPLHLTEGHLVFLCSGYVRTRHISEFHLGYLPILMAPNTTKETMILPEKYWTEDWINFYYQKGPSK